MTSKIILSSILTTIALTACSTTPTTPNTPIVIEQHKNISAEPTTKHNLARLIKQQNNCVIEFTGFYHTGKVTEYWLFKNQVLIQASSTKTLYAKDALNRPIDDPKYLTRASTTSKLFNIHQSDTLKNFENLKENFSSSALIQCDDKNQK